MRIILVGATGFIGRHVVAQLVERGHSVAVVHRGKTQPQLQPGVEQILSERSRLAELRDQFEQWQPDVAVDMILSSAAQARATLEAFRGIAHRLVAISSGDVYRAMAVHWLETGPLEPVPLRESSKLRTQRLPYPPETLAAARAAFPWIDDQYDKIEVEEEISAQSNLPATILRLPMVYGSGDPIHRLYPVIKRIRDGRSAILYEETAASSVPCRGYVENVANAIALAAMSGRAGGRVYNVAEPHAYSEAEWAAKIGALAGWTGRVITVPRDQAPKHLILPYNSEQHLFMDSSRIRSELGYTELIPVEEAIRRTIEWEEKNPPRQIDPKQFNYAAEDETIARLDA